MNCKIILYAILRDKLPPEAHGRVNIDMPNGSTIGDVITKLDLPIDCICTVNEQIEKDMDRIVKDGDTLRFFLPSSGGSI